MKCETLVDKILDSDHHVRFAAIFDMTGSIKASKERKGLTRMLSTEETGKWASVAVTTWKNREHLYPMIGEGQYVLAVYKNLKRITMPVGKEGQYVLAVYKNLKRITMPVGKNHLIYVTFDNDGGQEDIIRAVLNQKPGYGVPGLE
jgi:hypothetical protein